jgi:hypothetical protein
MNEISRTQQRKKNATRQRAEKIMDLLRGRCRNKCAYLDYIYLDQVLALEAEGLVAYQVLLPKIKVWATSKC